ncbi:DinB family protein [Bacillus timonensis]|nr:DinB family protein [Bacillus timonensis]
MNNITLKHFEMTRRFFLRKLEAIDSHLFHIQPEGFNNNIHWHIGHVLTVTEQFMFSFPKKTQHLPEAYVSYFGNGTKPADWDAGVPSVQTLIEQLKEQVSRLQAIPVEQFNETLKKPFLGLESFGELANMALFHEAHHLGQIHTMSRVIGLTEVKN